MKEYRKEIPSKEIKDKRGDLEIMLSIKEKTSKGIPLDEREARFQSKPLDPISEKARIEFVEENIKDSNPRQLIERQKPTRKPFLKGYNNFK